MISAPTTKLILLIALITLLTSCAGSGGNKGVNQPAVRQRPTPPPEPQMTREEKVSGLKGEKVMLLSEEISDLPRQPTTLTSASMCWLGGGVDLFKDKTPYAPYAGKTGTITEASLNPKGDLELVVTLSEPAGKNLTFCQTEFLGFFGELEHARSLIGKTFWNKKKITLGSACNNFDKYETAAGAIQVPPFSQLTVTRADWGFRTFYGSAIEPSRIPVILYFKTESNQEGCIAKKLALVERLNIEEAPAGAPDYRKKKQDAFASLFYFQDPREIYSDWSDEIWLVVKEGKVAIGMTLEMAEVACGGALLKEGFVISAQTGQETQTQTAYSCDGRKFLVKDGRVSKLGT